MQFESNAIKLYVFVDNLQYESPCPITVIINRYKLVGDLKREFAGKKSYLESEQYWLVNKQFCYDDMEIGDIVKNMDKYQNGYVAILFMLTDEDKQYINEFIVTFLENRYLRMNFKQRWRDPIESPFIIADVVDRNQVQTSVGWNCGGCTFLNKPYMICCQICGLNRPNDYQIPKKYFLTEDDRTYLDVQNRLEMEAKQKDFEAKQKLDLENQRNAEKLRIMYQQVLIANPYQIHCPLCQKDIEPGQGIILHSCSDTFCRACLKRYLITIDDPNGQCPNVSCLGTIQSSEIEGILTKDEYAAFKLLKPKQIKVQGDMKFLCLMDNCDGWILYQENINYFLCPICKNTSCMLCQVIHNGQSCKEYQDNLELKSNENDIVSKRILCKLEKLIAIGKATRCPHCQLIVHKKGHCNQINCNNCKNKFPWPKIA